MSACEKDLRIVKISTYIWRTLWPPFFFFLNDTAPPEFYPLPLHAALPTSSHSRDRSRSTRFPVAVAPDDRNMSALLEVAEPNAAYAATIDADRLEAWPDFFVERCLYKITKIGRAHV